MSFLWDGKECVFVRVMYFYHDYNIFDCIDVTRSGEFVPYPGAFLYSACLPKAYNMRAPVLCYYEYKRRKVAHKISLRRVKRWGNNEFPCEGCYGIRRVHTIFHKVSFVTVDMCKYCQDKHYVRANALFVYTQNVRAYRAVAEHWNLYHQGLIYIYINFLFLKWVH